MLYHFLRFVILVMLRAFFGGIQIKGLEQVPRKGGLILAANHPSTFLDPLVVVAWLRRPVYFLANGGIFTSPAVKWLLRQLYMIPIYRKQDSKDASGKNQDSFAACHELLREGGCLVIFPEGSSENERRLRPVKTGTARIALGAQAGHPSDIHLVCVGINYTNPRKFLSKLWVQYDAPIEARAYSEAFQADPTQAVQQLTNAITQRLTAMIVNTANEEADRLVHDIEEIYSNQLKAELQLQAPETEQVFMIARQIAAAVHHFEATQPQRVGEMRSRLDRYMAQLAEHQISDKLVAKYPSLEQLQAGKWGDVLALVAGFPLYVYSEVHNFLPYRIPGWIAQRYVSDIVFRAPINMVAGLLTFSVFYPIYWYTFHHFFPNAGWWLGLYAVSLPLSGYYAFRYFHFWRRQREKWRFAAQVATNPPLFADLQTARAAILAGLDQAKAEYLASQV